MKSLILASIIVLSLVGIVGVQDGFSLCVQNEDSPPIPCLDEIISIRYEHTSQEPFELQKSITEASFESGKIHLRIWSIEDSRCPSDVQCVWEGQVTVNVNVVVNREDLGNYSISLNEPLDGSLIQLDGYSLQLIKVEPYPTSTELIPVWDYVTTMKFSMNEILPPLKQITTGVNLQDVICAEELQLIFKSSDNSPACVKSTTAKKLIERGWGVMTNIFYSPPDKIIKINVDDQIIPIHYSITTGKITEITSGGYDLIVNIDTDNAGFLTISIPKIILPPGSDGVCNKTNIIILSDGQEVIDPLIEFTRTTNIISIPFTKDTSEIKFLISLTPEFSYEIFNCKRILADTLD